MIHVLTENNRLVIRAEQGDLAPRHQSQLAYWGFQFDTSSGRFVAPPGDAEPLAQKVTAYLGSCGCSYQAEATVQSSLAKHEAAESSLAAALVAGLDLKSGSFVTDHFKTNHQRSNQNQPVISLSL